MNVRILKRTDHSVSARRLINSSATCPWKVSLSALDEMKAKNLTKINKNCSMNTKIFGRKQQRHSYANKIMVKNTFTLLDSSNRWNLCLSYQIKQFTNEKTIYLLVNLAGGEKKRYEKRVGFVLYVWAHLQVLSDGSHLEVTFQILGKHHGRRTGTNIFHHLVSLYHKFKKKNLIYFFPHITITISPRHNEFATKKKKGSEANKPKP